MSTVTTSQGTFTESEVQNIIDYAAYAHNVIDNLVEKGHLTDPMVLTALGLGASTAPEVVLNEAKALDEQAEKMLSELLSGLGISLD